MTSNLSSLIILPAGVYKMSPTVSGMLTESGMFQEVPNRPGGTNRPRGTQMIVVSEKGRR